MRLVPGRRREVFPVYPAGPLRELCGQTTNWECPEVSVKIRLKRFGRRHKSFYRLSVMDIRSPRNGRVIEELGWYDPESKNPDKQVSFDRERIAFWLGKGAQPSDTVRDLFKRHGVGAEIAADSAVKA